MRAFAPLLLAAALAACRSPFSAWDETGPPEDPQKVGVGVHGWPLYERAPGSTGVRTDVLWPVASVITNHDGSVRRADVVYPVFRYASDGAHRRIGVRPLFDVEHDVQDGGEVEDVDLLFPLVKWRTAPDASRFEVRPLWFSGHEGAGHEWTAFFPFGASWHDDAKGTSGWWAGPFAAGGWTNGTRQGHQWAWGLVVHEEDPAKEKEETNFLYGVGQSKRWKDGSSWRFFPLAGGSEDTSARTSKWHVLWPGLVRHAREGDATKDWALPLWYREADADSSTSLVVPVWFAHEDPEGSTRILFPLYGATHEPGLDRRYFGGNLLWLTERPDGGGVDVLFPLFHYGSQGEDWNGWLFPVLWMKEEAGRGHWHVWPLVGKTWDAEKEATGWYGAFPLFGYEEDRDGWNSHLFPVLWLKRSEQREYTHLWPLFGTSRRGDTTTRSVLWPFFRHESGPDGWTTHAPAPLFEMDRQGEEHETRLFPLWRHASKPADGSYHGNLLLFLSRWEGDGKGTSDFNILWRFVHADETPERSVLAVNPFFRHETNARGDEHWSALFGLVARTREAEAVRWRLFWFATF